MIDYYVENYPWRTDPKLYRLSCLVSHICRIRKPRALLRVDYLRETALNQFFSKERTPWEILSLKYSESPTEHRSFDLIASERQLVSTSILSHNCPPHLLDREAIYAITHIVLFSTRFGQSDPSSIMQNVSSVKSRLFEILEYSLLSNEADLSAELILSILSIGGIWEEVSSQFNEVNNKFEFSQLFEGQITPSMTQEHFWDKYHTSLVLLMVGALSG